MADQTEPKARYPKQEVSEGQKAGYIGEVEVYDPPTGGHTNTDQTAADVTPAEKPIVGTSGVIGGTTENVAPKKR